MTHPITWERTVDTCTMGNQGAYRIEKLKGSRRYFVYTNGILLGGPYPTLKEAKARAQSTEDHWRRECEKEPDTTPHHGDPS